MSMVSEGLRWYVSSRLSTDKGWQGVQVIVSDASIPGEGEHKLMEFIRNQRMQPGYDPNTSHCIYGLDADLIMLSLVTHELRFSVLREMVTQTYNTCKRCGKAGHMMKDCTAGLEYVPRADGNGYSTTVVQQFQFVDIPTLKEYLEFDLRPGNSDSMAFPWDIERACDDFVLLCFLVGNDFLPHLPAMEIREGAIDVMMSCYREMLPGLGGYLARDGQIEFPRLGALMKRIAALENDILLRRADDAERFSRNSSSTNLRHSTAAGGVDSRDSELKMEGVVTAAEVDAEVKRLRDAKLREAQSGGEPQEVKFGQEGWEDRYYRIKFGRPEGAADKEFVRDVAHSFVDGMVWVLQYYFQGCLDWAWFYPYNYPPTSASLANAIDWDHFEHRIAARGATQPFTPLQQLMAVLPSGSAWCLPRPYAQLMTDPASPLVKYYPLEFKQDAEGLPPQQAYKAVALLPFIDAKELQDTLAALEPQLTPAERRRNQFGRDRLFVSRTDGTKVTEELQQCVERRCTRLELRAPGERTNLFGFVSFCEEFEAHRQVYAVPFVSATLVALAPNNSLCAYFECGPMPEDGYVARVLPNARRPMERTLAQSDHREMRSSRGTHATDALFRSRTRAFDAELPTQGINPMSAPGEHGRATALSWQRDQRRDDWERREERVSFDIVVRGFPPEAHESRLQALLLHQCALLGLGVPNDGFRIHRIASGLVFVRGQNVQDQDRNMQLVNTINSDEFRLSAELPKSSGRSRGSNNNNNQQQDPRRHPQQQPQRVSASAPMLSMPVHGHYAGQVPVYGQLPMPQYYQQQAPMAAPVPVWMQPNPMYSLPVPAGFAPHMYPQHQMPPQPPQNRKRVDAPAELVDLRAEELKRAKPERPDQLVAQLSQLQKLAALQAKLDAIKNAAKK